MRNRGEHEGADLDGYSPVEHLTEVFDDPAAADYPLRAAERPGPTVAGHPLWPAAVAVMLLLIVVAAVAALERQRSDDRVGRASATTTYPGPQPSARPHATLVAVQPFVPVGKTSVSTDDRLHRFTLAETLTYVGGGPSTVSATVHLVDSSGHPVRADLAMLTAPAYRDQVIANPDFHPPGAGGLVPGTTVLLVVRQRVMCPRSTGSLVEPSLQFGYGDEAAHQVFTARWSDLVVPSLAGYSTIVHGACGGSGLG
ncbi:hypothetical protein M6D93_11760 [Jatrophihabitans telluris]|uniref:DUF4352 domain-containing protein n=1 Tax=Jatrophihabitans telluris TaxID=2038343 RepID=A0ABY4QV47_9ACTN|nr:hypothetical protein [Jatrophihabitans telluris]UQX86982.1 hypothetical protein M6D93_11760 [Jatrophihabitans telluris]